ncbi:HypC/HybG/HupF family hydrogenase formation chaperone [Marinospirillum perlucidum]|uniref:HypC/HybG/HupF family hydrogenase formation chaperone n=1 Tax=Marinospirillum perlucidum TaxID=1982602 RepID=UPI000DF11DEC|nr:HypC/HybG/HupF family hydrogenase formation chaperone [Marinospirillum perlucidum]
MCLAVPVAIEALIDDQTARVNLGGIKKNINIALIDDPQVGDYVILHVGVALKKLDQEEAERTLALFGELQAQEEEQ